MKIVFCVLIYMVAVAAMFLHRVREEIISGVQKSLYLLTASLGLAVFLLINNEMSTFELILLTAGAGILHGIAAVDLKKHTIDIIPTVVLYALGALMLVRTDISYILSHMLCAIVFLAVMAAGRKLSKGCIGMGDVILMPAIGLLLGIEAGLRAAVGGLIVMTVTGLILTAVKKIGFKDELPLAPFMLIGYIFCSV